MSEIDRIQLTITKHKINAVLVENKKQCSKCQEWKWREEFHKSKANLDGLKYQCKVCRNLGNKEVYHKDIERSRAYQREKNKRLWKTSKVFRENSIEATKQWHEGNKDIKRERNRKWRRDNREKYLASKRKSTKKSRATAKGKINHSIGTAIWAALCGKKNGRRWQDIVGYSLVQLKCHLDKNMPEGRTWEEYMEGKLHLHHKIPREFFQFESSDDVEFKMCWRLENLVLLDAIENVSIKNNIIMR